ncbi:MAG: DUF86 domain-containing protein [Bacteroidales bacterium]|nr:DUF86 domain-containing protein [Bacteroidales bacterium]
MREKVRDSGRLEHILTAIENVESFLEGKSYEDLCRDKILFFAVVKNIEIIGEAANNITKELRAKHPEVCWKDVISMRHVLVHDYYNINSRTAWQTSRENLPQLKTLILAIYNELE